MFYRKLILLRNTFVLLLNKVWCYGLSCRSVLWSTTTSLFKWIYPHAGIIKDSQTIDLPLLSFLLKLCSHFLWGHIVRSNPSLSEQRTGWTTSDPCRCDYGNFLTRPKAKHVSTGQTLCASFQLKGIVHPKMKICWKWTHPRASCRWVCFRILRNSALHHLLINESSAVNGCRQNESPNSW